MRLLLALGAFAAALTAAVSLGTDRAATAPTAPRPCTNLRIGLLAPLSGPAAATGHEQQRWARFGLRRHNKANPRLKLQLVEHDTLFDPEQARVRAAQLAADPRVVAVLGPAGSREVPTAGAELTPRGVAFVSGSARAPELTTGKTAVRGFHRVVASDLAQAPLLARFAVRDLKAKQVVILDDASEYGVALAVRAERQLAADPVTVTRRSFDPQKGGLPGLVERIPAGADVIILLWSSPALAPELLTRLRAKGRMATVVGADRLDSAEWLTGAEGQYFASYVPDLRAFGDVKTQTLLRDYAAEYGLVETKHGPPVYVALQAVLDAVKRACRDRRVSRVEVQQQLAAVRIASILRYQVRFRRGDVPAARFFVYRVSGGTATFVR
jgi:branched-chain amino acid transport system substrate-binding protein